MNHRILVVGSAADDRVLAELLALHGFEVAEVSHSHAAGVARTWFPDAVIADAAFPEIQGRSLARALASLDPHPRTIVISPRPTRALEQYGVTCIAKPVDVDRLVTELAA